MKFSISIIFGVISFIVVVPMIALGAFNDVNLTTGTTLNVTVGGGSISLTVTNGVIQSIDVTASDLAITLAAGSSIDISSSDKRSFTYNLGNATASFSCNSSSSVLNLGLSQGQSVETVTVIPTSDTCVVAGSSGGGGSSVVAPVTTSSSSDSTSSSSSSSSASTPSTTTTTSTTVSTPVAVVSTPTTTVVASTPTVIAVSTVRIDSELNPGVRSDEVTDLQKLLAKDPEIYPEGTVSGFYGPKTTAAVKKFQAKYGLPTVGRVGPATMAKLNEVLGTQATNNVTSTTGQTADQIQSQIQAIQSQIQGITSGSSSVSGVITSEINPGTRNDEVTVLQQLLSKDPEIYPEGTVSGFYGPKTTAAVKKFQAKYGLPTVGRVGPATMAKLNEVLVGGTTSVGASTPVQSSSSDVQQQIQDQIKAIQAQIDALLKQ